MALDAVQILCSIHAGQLVIGDSGEGLELDGAGDLLAQHTLQLTAQSGHVHLQRGHAADQCGAAGLGFGQGEGGDLPHLIADVQFGQGAVQRSQIALQTLIGLLQAQQGEIQALAALEDLALAVAQLAKDIVIFLFDLTVFQLIQRVLIGS